MYMSESACAHMHLYVYEYVNVCANAYVVLYVYQYASNNVCVGKYVQERMTIHVHMWVSTTSVMDIIFFHFPLHYN